MQHPTQIVNNTDSANGCLHQRMVGQHVGTPQTFLFEGRVLVWFSCGAASACAAKLAVEKHKDKTLEIIYCDTLKYEHPDNVRFLKDVEQWIQWPVKIMRSKEYVDIFDVFDKTGYLVGPNGARCTTEMKKKRPQGIPMAGGLAHIRTDCGRA